jgi:hypothetical protein
MPHISPLNPVLILWGIATTLLAVLTTPNNERRFEMNEIKDAVMDTVRILFVVAWIGTVLALITIGVQQAQKVSGPSQLPTSTREEVK